MQSLLAAPVVALILAASTGAGAAPPCHDYRDIVEVLGRKYQERAVSLGVQTNGDMLQVFASNDKGTWTILTVQPSGRACIVAAGKHWEERKGKGDDDPEV